MDWSKFELYWVVYHDGEKAIVGRVLQVFSNGDVIVVEKEDCSEEKIFLKYGEYLPG